MCERFNQRYDRSGTYALKVDALASRFGKADLIPLWVADMDFPAPEAVVQAMAARVDHGIFGYTMLTEAYYRPMLQWYATRHSWEINPQHLLHSPGVITSLSLLVEHMTRPGAPIVLMPPVYTPFYHTIEKRDRKVLEVPLLKDDTGYYMDFDRLEVAFQASKLLILCSPHNPVGRVWTREELERLATLCEKWQVRVIADEIHADFSYAPHKHLPFASLSPDNLSRTVTCLAPTKTFNLAGLQASYIVCPDPEVQSHLNTEMAMLDIQRCNPVTMAAVEAAYTYGAEWLEALHRHIQRNIALVHETMRTHIPELIPNRPQGTYLMWVDCRALGLDDDALFRMMVHEAGVAIGPGRAYGTGGTGYIRLNLACSTEALAMGLAGIQKAVEARRQ